MRVLLIEDDSATAQSIELMLKSESFNVYTTDLGEEGVDLGKLYDYDIILLDLNLPDMSGYEVLRTLRVAKVQTPILILSGLAGIEDKVRGLGFGVPEWLAAGAGAGEVEGGVTVCRRQQWQIKSGAGAVDQDMRARGRQSCQALLAHPRQCGADQPVIDRRKKRVTAAERHARVSLARLASAARAAPTA